MNDEENFLKNQCLIVFFTRHYLKQCVYFQYQKLYFRNNYLLFFLYMRIFIEVINGTVTKLWQKSCGYTANWKWKGVSAYYAFPSLYLIYLFITFVEHANTPSHYSLHISTISQCFNNYRSSYNLSIVFCFHFKYCHLFIIHTTIIWDLVDSVFDHFLLL